MLVAVAPPAVWAVFFGPGGFSFLVCLKKGFVMNEIEIKRVEAAAALWAVICHHVAEMAEIAQLSGDNVAMNRLLVSKRLALMSLQDAYSLLTQ